MTVKIYHPMAFSSMLVSSNSDLMPQICCDYCFSTLRSGWFGY